jgi:hypothetical protein
MQELATCEPNIVCNKLNSLSNGIRSVKYKREKTASVRKYVVSFGAFST